MIGVATRGDMTQPIMVKMDSRHFNAEIAEGMEIAMPRPAPAVEPDAELDRAMRLAKKFGLVDPQIAVEFVDRRHGCLADADGADRLGFDEGDRV